MDVNQKIVSGSLELFMKYGIKPVTMDMIAQELGLSKRTIYENFADKDELVRCCVDKMDEERNRSFTEILENSSNVIEALFRIMRQTIKVMSSVNPLFNKDIKKYFHEIHQSKFKSSENCRKQQAAELLEKGKREGLFRQDVDVKIIAEIYLAQIKSMNYEDVFPEELYSKKELVEHLLVNLLRGIATPKGMEMIEKYTN
jgi:AcrR family transcriptional regulator